MDKERKINEFEEKEDLILLKFEEIKSEEEIPLRFEKRKALKADLEEGDEFAGVECPFCGEIYDDLPSHIQNCEFAPDDASLDDILPSKPKKKRKKKTPKKKASGEKPAQVTGTGKSPGKKSCPYCGKEFVRLGRHLNFCLVFLNSSDGKENNNRLRDDLTEEMLRYKEEKGKNPIWRGKITLGFKNWKENNNRLREDLTEEMLSSNWKEKKECPYCKEEFVSLGRHLSYCRKNYKRIFRKIYKTLLELSKNFTRIHLQELVNKTKIDNLDLTKEIVKFFINEDLISAKYDDLSNGIEFLDVEKEINEILSKFDEWEKNQNDTGKQKNI